MVLFSSLPIVARTLFAFVMAAALAVSGLAPTSVAATNFGHSTHNEIALDEGGSAQGCDEHGAEHAAMQGNHCCASTAMGIATPSPETFSLTFVITAVAWLADEPLSTGPIFGIFRPPRVE